MKHDTQIDTILPGDADDTGSTTSTIALTAKQRRFVAEYQADGNATQAAIRAGYSEDTARAIGCENLMKPHIRVEIDRQEAERLDAAGVTADYVIAALVKNHEKANAEGKLSDSTRALELLGKHLKLWTDKVEAMVQTHEVRVIAVPKKDLLPGERPEADDADRDAAHRWTTTPTGQASPPATETGNR